MRYEIFKDNVKLSKLGLGAMRLPQTNAYGLYWLRKLYGTLSAGIGYSSLYEGNGESTEIAKPAEPVKMNGAYAPPLMAPPAFAGRQSRGDSKECCRQLSLCGLAARKHLALQAVPVQQVLSVELSLSTVI